MGVVQPTLYDKRSSHLRIISFDTEDEMNEWLECSSHWTGGHVEGIVEWSVYRGRLYVFYGVTSCRKDGCYWPRNETGYCKKHRPEPAEDDTTDSGA